MVPEGWEVVSFSKIASLSKAKFDPRKSNESPLCVELEHISQGTGELLGHTFPNRKSSIKAYFEHGDVLFGKLRPYLRKYLYPDCKGVCSTEIWVLKAKLNTYSKYLYYIIQTEMFIGEANKSTGSKMPRADWDLISNFILRLPPKAEQIRIAQILSTWDNAIEIVDKLIANSQQQKKALMQQLLVSKKRFLQFQGAWKSFTIKQMGQVVSGGTPDTNNNDYWNGEVCWTTPTDITALKNRFIKTTKRKITEEGVKNSSARLLPPNTILVCTRATLGYFAIASTEITTNQGFKNLIPHLKFDSEFLYFLFSYFKYQFIRYACGSTFMELSKKDFENLVFSVPEKKEQRKIAQILIGADTEIEATKTYLAYLQQEKKFLMQQLLTGKRRVKIESETMREVSNAL